MNMPYTALFRLNRGICYQRYEDFVYLRHIDARKDYLFNGIVYDILRCFPGDTGRTKDEVAAVLLEQYCVSDRESFRREIDTFLQRLTEEGILVTDHMDVHGGAELPAVLQIQEVCAREHLLFSAALELTYRCNERCIHCYVDGVHKERGQNELTLEEYKGLLDELRDMGCVSLLLTGGEVGVKDCFLEVTEYAASLGMAVDLFTNGLTMTPEILEQLRQWTVNSVSYSLYGGTAPVHDAITKIPGSFQRTLMAALMTKCAGIDTYIKTVVMKENQEDLSALLQLGKRLGIPVAAGFAVLDTHSGRSGTVHQLSTREEIQHALRLLSDGDHAGTAAFHRKPDSLICNAGQCSLSIDPYGNVRPCLALPITLGNIRKTPLRKIWAEAPELRDLRNLRLRKVCRECESCGNIDECELCLARIKFLPDGGTEIPRDVCLLAEESRNMARRNQS